MYAYVVTHKNDTYLIKNVEYNQDLESGKTVEIGFTFQGDFEDKPRNYRLLEEMSMNTLEDYAISFNLISNWDNGGTTNLTIANNSLNVIEDWIIEFDYEADIVDIWNADILKHTGNHYVLKNKQYNAYIQAGGNVTIGFNFSADSIDDEPKNYMLYNRN